MLDENKIFKITDADRRKEFIKAVESGNDFVTQKPSGQDVEVFDPNFGFVLVRKDNKINPKYPRVNRAVSVAKMSLRSKMALREFYYALGAIPELIQPFEGSQSVYEEVLGSINTLEIFCDLNRDSFVMGNNPNGQMFYGHDWDFGNPNKPIGMTENLARENTILDSYKLRNAMSVIHLEKVAAIQRLIAMGFSKLTNSLITTTGGNFTRAVYCLADRFHSRKPMIFFCDGDAYGNDMLRSLEYGTQASRHLTLDQAFPSSRFKNIHVAGLFPSVAERLNVDNDREQRRPMTNPQTKKRIEFLQRYGLIDQRDLDTWTRNNTYEMESFSIRFKSTKKDEDGEYPPIGLGIYLAEFMRLNEILCKPQPLKDDDELLETFEREAKNSLQGWIEDGIEGNAPFDKMKEFLEEKMKKVIEDLAKKLYDEYIDRFLDEYIKTLSADDIRKLLLKQYEDDPNREVCSLHDILDDIVCQIDIDVEWNEEEMKAKIEEAIEQYVSDLPKDIDVFVEHDIKFCEFDVPDELRSFYDVIEDEIGAKPEDCEEVREALEWRLK